MRSRLPHKGQLQSQPFHHDEEHDHLKLVSPQFTLQRFPKEELVLLDHQPQHPQHDNQCQHDNQLLLHLVVEPGHRSPLQQNLYVLPDLLMIVAMQCLSLKSLIVTEAQEIHVVASLQRPHQSQLQHHFDASLAPPIHVAQLFLLLQLLHAVSQVPPIHGVLVLHQKQHRLH